MADLNFELAAAVEAHLSEQAGIIDESINQCFDLTWKVGSPKIAEWAAVVESIAVPGVVCVFQCGEVAALMLIPEAIGLPSWYQSPNDSQKARLDTLAMEWGMNLIPPDLEAERTVGYGVDDLRALVDECRPADELATIQLAITNADGQELPSLLLVWPITQPRWEPLPKPEQPVPAVEAAPVASAPPSAAVRKPNQPDPLARLRKLPVAVSVRLTERRINVSQLLAIAPGALITFDKSCEDLLDLYINNALYARGEAVKIGEKFGLKINEVGIKVERKPKILEG